MTSNAEALYVSIRLPDGVVVCGRGVEHPLAPGPLPEFGFYLGADYHPTWDSERVQWPNCLLPRDLTLAARLITATHAQAPRA
jgi:hypothetical protein